MLWSLIKILLFFCAVAILSFGADFLLHWDQGLHIGFAGWEFSLGPFQAVLVLMVLAALIWLVMKAVGLIVASLRFVSGDETALSRYFDRNRQKKGYQALSEGLMALASGEGRLALLRAQRAESYLQQPEITALLVAQAAEAVGDTARATAAYKQLLADDRSRFVGVRGLLKQKLAEGDTETALKLAEKAFSLRPKHIETQDILLQLQSSAKDWSGARQTLGAKARAGGLPKDIYRRRDAVLALEQAKGIIDDAASVEAREAAIEAHKKSPDLIPAVAMAARAYIAGKDTKAADRILKKAWSTLPHPDLAAAFAEIAPDETPTARLSRFQGLAKQNPGHPETKMMLAEMFIAVEDFPSARRAMGDLAETPTLQRAFIIMAAIDRGEGAEESVVRGWLSRALSAPRGPQWCCDTCHAIHAEWTPHCSNCNGFDTLSWRQPAEMAAGNTSGIELLPLLVNPPKKSEDVIDLSVVARGAG